jgi:C4-type Zn-finger protein
MMTLNINRVKLPVLTVPEIDLVLTQGTLGGRFTTVEGILVQIYEELGEKTFLRVTQL